MNKSYNPFKMRGSWIGFIVGFFLFFLIIPASMYFLTAGHDDSIMECCNLGGCDNANFGEWINCQTLPPIPIPFLSSGINWFFGIFGFLMGWGIHSLIRKSKKTNFS
ncbi:hypothetical protein KJ751_01800 [Patescibacteria group bacterium]|nr:hypothetical protein [Patescibacteria group bacterium]